MLNDSIRILNFDDSITKQEELLSRYKNNILDFSGLGPHVRYYLSAKYRSILEHRIAGSDKNSITFLGSGDFHHISEILLARFRQPLCLIMFDLHPDWDKSIVRYGCGSWLTEVLKKKNNILKVILLGVSSRDISSFQINSGSLESLQNDRVEIYPYEHEPSKTFLKKVSDNISIKVERTALINKIYWQELKNKNLTEFFPELLSRLPVKDVYVSIDKDCLKNEFAVTNWEEGRFSLEEFLSMLNLIKQNLNIVGLDITGDYSPIRLRGLFKRVASRLDHPRDIKAQNLPGSAINSLNQETNLKILQLLFT